MNVGLDAGLMGPTLGRAYSLPFLPFEEDLSAYSLRQVFTQWVFSYHTSIGFCAKFKFATTPRLHAAGDAFNGAEEFGGAGVDAQEEDDWGFNDEDEDEGKAD